MEFLLNKEQFDIVKSTWSKKNTHTSKDIIIYNILRNKNIRNGFTDRKSNIQGNDPWYGYKVALGELLWMNKEKFSLYFKNTFGIDLIDEVNQILRNSK